MWQILTGDVLYCLIIAICSTFLHGHIGILTFFMPWPIVGGENMFLDRPSGCPAISRDAISLYLHGVRKKGATLFLPVTPRSANRFSKFFYHYALQ